MLLAKAISYLSSSSMVFIAKDKRNNLTQKEIFSVAFDEASKAVAKEMGYKIKD